MFTIPPGERFDVLKGMLKASPGEVYVSEVFMATWIPSWNGALVVVGDYRKHSQKDIERILLERFDKFNLEDQKRES